MAKGKHKNSVYSTFPFKFLILTTIIAISFLGFKSLVQNNQENNVLGTTSYLADKGSDSGESSGSSSNTVQAQAEPTHAPEIKIPEPTHAPEINMESLGKVQFESENGRTKLHLEQGDSKLEISNEDGKLSIKAKNENGTELQLQEENALEKINEALKDEDVEVGTGSGNLLTIRRGQIEAETHFPLSLDPKTNTLTVTTPAGVKNVTVLPDQAVNNLLRQRFIDRISSQSATGAPQNIILGLLNNDPTFQINGVDDQKFLGLFPVGIAKTSFVSAVNGQVVKVDETFLNRLLDLFSL